MNVHSQCNGYVLKLQKKVTQTSYILLVHLQVDNRSTRKRCEICSKLTIKTP